MPLLHHQGIEYRMAIFKTKICNVLLVPCFDTPRVLVCVCLPMLMYLKELDTLYIIILHDTQTK